MTIMTTPENTDRITLAWLRERDACWSDAQIESLLPPDGCTILEALDCDAASTDDLIWLGIEWLPAREQRLFACWCAARALRRAGVEDIRSWRAVRVAARYACGKATGEELSAARATAWDAARSAGWGAARDAARAAAWHATLEAARDTERGAERAAQLEQLRIMCGRLAR